MGLRRWRTVLFVPGDRPDRVDKAGRSGADAVAIDLEDAVAGEAKDRARAATVEHLRTKRSVPTMVRINARDSGELERDVEQLAPVWANVDAVILPEASGASDVKYLDELLQRTLGPGGPAMIPIVETAVGVFEARATAAASPRVNTLLFGPADLTAELGIAPSADGHELAFARAQVVLAAAAAHLAGPIDGPHLVLADDQGLTRSTRSARELGFAGKAVIHPEQITIVNAGFGPTSADLTWAEQVLAAVAADGAGALRLADGTFIDEAIVRRARKIIAEHQGHHGGSTSSDHTRRCSTGAVGKGET